MNPQIFKDRAREGLRIMEAALIQQINQARHSMSNREELTRLRNLLAWMYEMKSWLAVEPEACRVGKSV